MTTRNVDMNSTSDIDDFEDTALEPVDQVLTDDTRPLDIPETLYLMGFLSD